MIGNRERTRLRRAHSGPVLVLFLTLFLLLPASSCSSLNPGNIAWSSTSTSTVSPATSRSAPTALPVTPTLDVGARGLVHLAWFFKPPSEMPIDSLPNLFDFFILTHKDEQERDLLLAGRNSAPMLEYLLLAGIMDPGDCSSDPNGNQVAYKAGDFCQISQGHPDWFLLDQSGSRIGEGGGEYYMDPGNAGYRSFWLERSREMQTQFGWNGIFIDNADASLAKFSSHGISLAKYPDDASFQTAVEGFLAAIQQNYALAQPRPILANIISVRDAAVWNRYIGHLDGAMMEAFATDSSGGRLSFSDWTEQMYLAETALAQGKKLILVSQGSQTNSEVQQFAFASYLLIANGNAAFRYADADSYREAWMYPDYSLSLGAPLGPRYAAGEIWRRDFTGGHVLVDPYTGRSEIVTSP